MNVKRLRSRIERIDRHNKGDECAACTRTAFEQIAATNDPNLTAPEHCPDCGNPNPRIPLKEIDALLGDEAKVEELERILFEQFNKVWPRRGSGSKLAGNEQ
jgi:hypothetical protein